MQNKQCNVNEGECIFLRIALRIVILADAADASNQTLDISDDNLEVTEHRISLNVEEHSSCDIKALSKFICLLCAKKMTFTMLNITYCLNNSSTSRGYTDSILCVLLWSLCGLYKMLYIYIYIFSRAPLCAVLCFS